MKKNSGYTILRYQVGKHFFINSDLTYTKAISVDEPKGENYIQLAPVFTFTGGISFRHPSGWNAAVKTRFLGHRPANEDYSITAKGYSITDMNVNYQWKRFGIGLITENIFNAAWNETQFVTESRLKNEASPATEIHFTPGTPFNIRGVLTYKF